MNGGHVSDQNTAEEPTTATDDESQSETDGTPTKDERTMFGVEDEELA
jgi:hypothetical protein